jgi:hypothetical protein
MRVEPQPTLEPVVGDDLFRRQAFEVGDQAAVRRIGFTPNLGEREGSLALRHQRVEGIDPAICH